MTTLKEIFHDAFSDAKLAEFRTEATRVVANHELGLSKLPLQKALLNVFQDVMLKAFVEEYMTLSQSPYFEKVYASFCKNQRGEEWDQAFIDDVTFLCCGDHAGQTFEVAALKKLAEKRKKQKA